MKGHFSRKLHLFLTLALLFTLAAELQAKRHRSLSASQANKIKATGCVAAGVEAGCLVLTDSKTKTVYNLFFRGSDKPAVGDAIRFTGAAHDGPTSCMQGKPVDVKEWKRVKIKCS